MEKRKYSDRRKYLSMAVAKKRRKIKLDAIASKGGKCVICGYSKFFGAMDFHHIRGPKEFSVGNIGYSRSKEKLLKELDKCILLCANCHREVEGGLIKVGGGNI